MAALVRSFLTRLQNLSILQTPTISRTIKMNSADLPELFQPPVSRSMKTLDKSFFRKVIPLAAASVSDMKQITNVRKELEKSSDMLKINPIKPLREDETMPGAKCFLLTPGVAANEPKTWSPTISRLVELKIAKLRPYDLTLTYDDWTMHNILEAILPEIPDDEKETPAGFAQVGHVAHVNLRTPYLPYKYLIGQVLLDKNPNVTTVINKTFDVGTESVFRTFPYEVLAGPDDLDVVVHESGCEFRFNFGKVYWNSRLGTEHARLFESFREGEAVCDVMAGVGPFAIPAGKRKVFVWANDLNPDSYDALQDAIVRNKVSDFVIASCDDGRNFVRTATTKLSQNPRKVVLKSRVKISRKASEDEKRAFQEAAKNEERTLDEPTAFSHYVMNLPASAIEFLDAFKGVYYGREADFEPHTRQKLPFVHLYLFQAKLDNEQAEYEDTCKRISEHIGAEIRLDDPQLDMQIRYVRLVAPKKKMFCASFRLPASVAFAQP
ncbi:Met-10+ like-protein-domain-containing protein [Exophiala viscosa]|uniref:tRNA (guanine(37)-N1)-methyltransferase n=1 Tax=Exophiala viscosa TaxID=2486360 RepID=A0AAN6II19_9EURO|nr:Met-10+ like-protein-domain-containing protein [Exophiala viscosa]KAI1627361.1 Met-10+ like-protein-domain-containing protein [Exophiala viscosa]